ncbi:HAD family hydrolase [Robiginitalea sp. SC105]|uniref:HAD family hydrolase n=1 Tax=Robiginitalea sp. SC105 TaxID=2762332 RepID=UPI0016395621|nr:HAD family hydrolase [Robiginitalea sp. SC105]MBC2840136.1 HAD family phosphatase [Robiginitalea sp. SC105]
MDLRNIRMVVTDMDGTLLDPDHRVSDRFFELFHELRGKGIRFVAASGRQYNSMVDKLERIADDILFIAENGALVREGDQTLLSTPLPGERLQEIMARAMRIENAHPVLCAANNAYVRGNSEAFLRVLGEYYSEFSVVDRLETVEDPALKVAIYHFESSEKFIYPPMQDLESELQVKVSGSNWVDVSHPDAHKGFALSRVMRDAGITSDQLMVFGDYNNDLEMLELSEFSFAMANSHPNVLAKARFRTGSNSEQGVEKILEKLARQL